MINYNIFHGKNVNIQKKLIDERNYTYQSLMRIFLKYLKANSGARRVLDFGCGVGTIDFYLANKGFETIGVDVSSRAINLAKKSSTEMNFKNVNFFCTSVEKYRTRKKFDYVIMSEVIEHLEDPATILRAVFSMMESGGLLVISTPLDTAPLYRWGCLKKFDRDVGHLRRYTEKELINTIIASGYYIVESFKTEGAFRNLLFTNNFFGVLLKVARWPLSIIFNLIDEVSIILFGASNIYVICRKK